MITGTLGRYFGLRFLTTVLAVFAGLVILTAMIDYIEMLRRTSDIKDVSAALVGKITLFRVPYLTERVMPFTVLVSTMFCYLTLSRRLELVVARSCGMSAWQFVAPAVIVALLLGVAATALYNPLSAVLREESARRVIAGFLSPRISRIFRDEIRPSGFDPDLSAVKNRPSSEKYFLSPMSDICPGGA